jgi:hypothetical protein
MGIAIAERLVRLRSRRWYRGFRHRPVPALLRYVSVEIPRPPTDHVRWRELHVKRTCTPRRPLQKGEKLRGRIDSELATVRDDPTLVRSFFQAPSVAYIRDC